MSLNTTVHGLRDSFRLRVLRTKQRLCARWLLDCSRELQQIIADTNPERVNGAQELHSLRAMSSTYRFASGYLYAWLHEHTL